MARVEPYFPCCPHPVTWRVFPFLVTRSRMHPASIELILTSRGENPHTRL